jgi:transposase-like protein
MARGRPTLGAGHAERLDGPAPSKQRLAVILRTLSGELSVEEACAQIGVSSAQFHRLRERALEGALSALAPGTPGRPPAAPVVEPSRVQELEAQVLELQIDLRASQLREEIAILMPHLLKPAPDGTKKKSRRRRGG